MTIPAAPPSAPDPVRWLNDQPYLLLSLTALFWAGNIVLARYVAGHLPPLTLTCIRWIGVFLILLPFALPHLKRDWPAMRANLPLMVLLSAIGFAFNNAISYWAMQYTQALNALLIQSSGPLFVALWSLALFGVRADLGPAWRHRHLAHRRADYYPARRPLGTRQHPLQQGRRDVCELAAGFRPLFGADAEAAGDSSIVADRVYHRLRCAVCCCRSRSGNTRPDSR